MVAKVQALALAVLARSGSAAPVSAKDAKALSPSNGTTALAQEGQCECKVDYATQFVFYNRVPKCGSTTMVNFMDEACQAKDYWAGKPWKGFTFVQSTDFDANHFHPDYRTRQQIVWKMAGQANYLKGVDKHEGRSVFERHIHYLDFEEFHQAPPVYLNLLRDPASLRASSFYFFRDCVCQQEPAHGDDFADEWCKSDWWRKSDAFCSMDINTCYDNLDACRDQGQSLGGSTLTDFTCGASFGECDDPGISQTGNLVFDSKFEAKAQRAITNIKTKYRWVGVLERMEDSLRLLSTLLPLYFGKMSAAEWAHQDVAPDGSSGNLVKAYANPSDKTKEAMMEDPYHQMDARVYRAAVEMLDCKMAACGQQPAALETAARDLEVRADKMKSQHRVQVHMGEHSVHAQ